MIKKAVFEDDLIKGMQEQLTANEQSAAVNSLDSAVESLHAAIEIFEEAGMKSQADAILDVLLKIAKKKSKKADKHTKNLTPEQMIANLLQYGTEFNMLNDGGINDLLEADIEERDNLDSNDVELSSEGPDWEDV